MALDRDECAHGLAIEQRADAAQVAESLLADGERDQHRGGGRREYELARHVQERRDPQRVVADARPGQAPVLAGDGEWRVRRKDGVEMRTQRQCRAVLADPRDHIANGVEGRIEAQRMQSCQNGVAALALEKGRRGDQAERLRSVDAARHGLRIGSKRRRHAKRVPGKPATHV